MQNPHQGGYNLGIIFYHVNQKYYCVWGHDKFQMDKVLPLKRWAKVKQPEREDYSDEDESDDEEKQQIVQ